MSGLSNYNGDHLHKSMEDDPNLVAIVPKTAYFTSNGQPMRWVIPEEFLEDDDAVFAQINRMKSK